jgi:hypothetical protein
MAIKHVAKSGADDAGRDGSSIATAWLTIGYALTRISGGDTIEVHGGSYVEHILNSVPGGTSWSNFTSIRNTTNEAVWLVPPNFSDYWGIYFGQTGRQYIQFSGINVDSRLTRGGFRVESTASGNPHHIRVRDCIFIGGPDGISEGLLGPQHFSVSQSVAGLIGGHEFINIIMHGGGDAGEMYYGFYINADNTLVDRCEIYDVSGYSVQVFSDYPGHPDVLNAIIRNCRIHDTSRSMDTRAGMAIASGHGHQVYNNVVWNQTPDDAVGVSVYPGVSAEVYFNTVYKIAGVGIRAQAGSTAVVRNNISYFCTVRDFLNDEPTTVVDHNVFSVDPLFRNEATYDLQLGSTSSPAYETGVKISGITTDILGALRSDLPEIGAYELTSVSSALFPMSFNDPVFTGMTESTDPMADIPSGTTVSRKSIIYNNVNWPTFFFLGNGVLDHCRALTRECVRLITGVVDIRWCYLEAMGVPPDDHADVIQVYGPGQAGTWNISNTTIRAHLDYATAGLFVADNTTSHVNLDHVLFWGGPFGMSIEGDGNPCTLSAQHVYFVRDSFVYQAFAIESCSILKWENVYFCDIVGGDIANLEVIDPPFPVEPPPSVVESVQSFVMMF